MFIFFINGLFYSFWQNKKGDEFFDLTCMGLDLNASQVSLSYYAGVKSIPEFYEFDENKNLLIKEKAITEVLVGPEGEQVLEEQISYNIKETILAEVFVINGEKFKTC
jgi:hypothetical protein